MVSGKESRKNLTGSVGNGSGNGTPLMEHESAPSFGTLQRKAMNSEDFRGDETTSNPNMGTVERKPAATRSDADSNNNRDDQPSRPNGVS